MRNENKRELVSSLLINTVYVFQGGKLMCYSGKNEYGVFTICNIYFIVRSCVIKDRIRKLLNAQCKISFCRKVFSSKNLKGFPEVEEEAVNLKQIS